MPAGYDIPAGVGAARVVVAAAIAETMTSWLVSLSSPSAEGSVALAYHAASLTTGAMAAATR